MKIALIDTDGVLLVKEKYFSERYSEKYGVPNEKIVPFFQKEFRLCQVGQADLKAVLPMYLEEWGWAGTTEEFMSYWFSTDAFVNEGVLEAVKKIRSDGVKCYLATDQEKYRAEYLWKTVELAKEFDGAFFSYELGVGKANPEFWHKVLEKLGRPNPSDIAYWDDEEENVAAARSVGIQARIFTGRIE